MGSPFTLGGFSYHADDLLKDAAFGNGLLQTNIYNGRGWPTSMRTSHNVKGTYLDLSYAYDDSGNPLTANAATFTYDGLDRLKTATGAFGTQTYGYDALGNRQGPDPATTVSKGSAPVAVGSSYGTVSYSLPVNPATQSPWSYDSVSALQAGIRLVSTNYVVRVTQMYLTVRRGDGTEATLYPNGPGDSTEWSQSPSTGSNYDKLDEGTADTTTYVYSSTPQATDLYAFQDLAGSGSISSVTVTAKAAVIGPKPPKLCFDQPQPCYGNIDLLVKLPGTVHTYSNGPSGMNELTLIRRADGTSTAFGYDPNGNLRSRTPAPAPRTGVECYDWNREGLLVSVRDVATDCGETGTQVQRYAYDGRGSRVKVEGTSGGTWTVSVFSGQEVLFEKDETGRTTKYVYAAGMRIARIDCTPHPNGPSYPSSCLTYYYHGDALGSTRKRTWHHPSVAVTFSAEYEPFGRAYTVQGSEAYKYTGEKHDDPTGLVYLRARQYDPEVERCVPVESR